jgi:hypothetical protein
MSSERRASANDEAEGSAALSSWLTDTLRPPRPDPVAAPVESAPEEPSAEESAAQPSSRVETWDDGGERTPALGTAVDAAEESGTSKALAAQPLPSFDFPEAATSRDLATEESPRSEPRADVETDEEADQAMAAAPVLSPSDGEAPPEFDDADPAALFLAQERSARRNQRVAIAALVAFLLLIGGSYLLMRGRGSEPEAQAAEAPVAAPAPPPIAAKPTEPAPPSEELETEVLEEEPVPGTKVGFSAALRAPGSSSAEPMVPGGPSTARYPDLPRDVLLQLENAATTAAGPEQQR